jgi:hypothetical protein
MISGTLPTHFEPSNHMLLSMIERAEAAFSIAREKALRDRAGSAFAHNARVIKESRVHDMRRRVFAGDRP